MSINQEWIEERKSKMLAAFDRAHPQETLDDIIEQCALVARSQYFGLKAHDLLRSMKSK